MHHWTKRLFAIAAPLLLTGCLWGPGKFTSDLTLRKDGSFVLDYRGEIVCRSPGRSEPAVDQHGALLRPRLAPTRLMTKSRRPCSKAEIARRRSRRMKSDSRGKRKKVRGHGQDVRPARPRRASNRAFAAKLMKYAGWRSVTYRGNGVFDVDYHFEGRRRRTSCFRRFPTTTCSSRSSPFGAARTDRCW